MADTVQHGHHRSGSTLYFHVRNTAAEVWSGANFEVYDVDNWATYDVALTEQESSLVYVGTFPTLDAGVYSVFVYEQAGASPAAGDELLGSSDKDWDGSAFTSLSAVETHGDATWTPPTADANAAAVWTYTDGAGRILSNLTAQLSAIASAVWANGTKTLTAFGFTVTTTNGPAIRVVTDKLADTLENDGGTQRFTANALEEGPGGDATEAKQDTIIAVTDKMDDTLEDDGGTFRFNTNALEQAPDSGDATEAKQDTIITAIGNLNDPTAGEVATAVLAATLEGAVTVATALIEIRAKARGKLVVAGSDPLTFTYYEDDDTTPSFVLTAPLAGTGRTVA